MKSVSKDENNFSNYSEINLLLQNPLKAAKKELYRRKYTFVSEIASLLIFHKENKEIYNIISRLILISLESQEIIFLEKNFIDTNTDFFIKKERFDYLRFLKKLHTFLIQSSQLSEKERVDFYRLERFFIKQYLDTFSF